jgi:hypothetical protein
VTSGRSRRSRRCAGRRRWWLELLWPRAQAAEVVGGACSGQTTVVGFNQCARGAPLGDVEAMRARNQEMVQWITRSTCSRGFTNSGERDCTVPVGLVLGSSSGKLHDLLRKLSEGSGRAEVGGNGLVTVGTLGRLWRVTGRSPELRASSGKLSAVRRGRQGRWSCMRVGFIATRGHNTGVVTGAAEVARGCACGRALGALPSACPRRTRGGLLLPVFNGLFGRLSMQISTKISCTVSSLHHILSFPCEFQAKIWSGLRDIVV